MKPLERIQLKTWRDYLDFEMAQGDQKRIVVLFERCMIACALYEEFWSKVMMSLDDAKKDAPLRSCLSALLLLNVITRDYVMLILMEDVDQLMKPKTFQ